MTSRILSLAKEAGLEEAVSIPVEDIIFYPYYYYSCKTNQCGKFGKNWACPPTENIAVEWNKKITSYNYAYLVGSTSMLPENDYFKAYADLKARHNRVFRTFVKYVRSPFYDIQPFSAEACQFCDDCTCPQTPCRFPDECYPAIEGVGLNVQELCKIGGIPLNSVKNMITFISLLLIKEKN